MKLLNYLLKGLNWVLLLTVILIFIFPFFWMITTAFKSFSETMMFPPKWIPDQWLWQNFVDAWQSGPFLHYYINSITVTVSILVLQFLTVIPASYAFARYRFKGDRFLFALIMITLMIPAQLIFLPVYLQMSSWGLIDSLASLIIPFASSAFGIFLIRQAFKQVPNELIEAARLDQASEWKIMWKIMVPYAKPTIITFALFSFITHWNDYFWPLVMTNSELSRTLPVGIARLRDIDSGASWNLVMAGNMLLVVPILVIFFLAQRHIIKAFVYTGVK
ncbi:carbohydrate ABC transporter permease [Evansella tamaricis]|uniref:Carbohydrate ABC transporter permease n=1 Tax=Evansella tamaricis TaxID=2069301 RepID=A0ABS6JG35_9BACI|nr:carbohydrate ABC transporter permease [Evansella tamaricis]MBU9711293.1 carbohydrate ABC transporter permease [Evansella tamaricis]